MKGKRLLTLMLAFSLTIPQLGAALGQDPSLSRVVADEENGDDEDWYEEMEEWDNDDDGEDLEKKKGKRMEEPANIDLNIDGKLLEPAWKSLRKIYDNDKVKDMVKGYTAEKRKWARTSADADHGLVYGALSDTEQRFYDDMNIICELFMYDPILVNAVNIDFFLNIISDTEPIQLPEGVALPANPGREDDKLSDYIFPVTIPKGMTSEEADKVYNKFMDENPQYYFMDIQCGTYVDKNTSVEVAKGGRLYPCFIKGGVDDPAEIPGMTLSNFEGMRESAQKAIEEIKNDSRYAEDDEWAKVRTAHDWLVNHVDYDYFACGAVPISRIEGTDYEATIDQFLSKDSPKKKEGDSDTCYQADGAKTIDQTLFSVFGRSVGAEYPVVYSDTNEPRYEDNRVGVDSFTGDEIKIDHYTVCAGYAAALTFLCQNLEVKAVTRSGGGHAWNIISVDDEEFNFDATWDDVGGKEKPYPLSVTYTYFARDDKFFENGHPKSGGSYTKGEMPCTRDIKPHGHVYYRIENTEDFRICMGDAENDLLYELVTNNDGNHELKMVDGNYVTYPMPDALKEQIETLNDTPGFVDHTDPDYPTVKQISKTIIAQQQGSGTGVGSVTPTSTSTPATGGGQTSAAAVLSGGSGSSGSSGSSTISFSQGGSTSSGKGIKRGVYSKCGKGKVSYEASAKKLKAKKIKVPAKVRIGKKKYKVTRILANAFTGFDKLEQLVIGKEIRSIGGYAFSGCKKLNKLTIRSKHLTAKGIKNAFKDSYVKTVYVPADKVSAYKKIFTKKVTGSRNRIKVRAIK